MVKHSPKILASEEKAAITTLVYHQVVSEEVLNRSNEQMTILKKWSHGATSQPSFQADGWTKMEEQRLTGLSLIFINSYCAEEGVLGLIPAPVNCSRRLTVKSGGIPSASVAICTWWDQVNCSHRLAVKSGAISSTSAAICTGWDEVNCSHKLAVKSGGISSTSVAICTGWDQVNCSHRLAVKSGGISCTSAAICTGWEYPLL